MNAGFTPFPISPRNSSESVAHLLESTGCKIVFVSDDPPIQRLSESSFALYEQRNPRRAPIHSLYAPSFDTLYSKEGGKDEDYLVSVRKIDDHSTPCVIIHSSGTVSFPKPIEITYRMFFEHALLIGNSLTIHFELKLTLFRPRRGCLREHPLYTRNTDVPFVLSFHSALKQIMIYLVV